MSSTSSVVSGLGSLASFLNSDFPHSVLWVAVVFLLLSRIVAAPMTLVVPLLLPFGKMERVRTKRPFVGCCDVAPGLLNPRGSSCVFVVTLAVPLSLPSTREVVVPSSWRSLQNSSSSRFSTVFFFPPSGLYYSYTSSYPAQARWCSDVGGCPLRCSPSFYQLVPSQVHELWSSRQLITCYLRSRKIVQKFTILSLVASIRRWLVRFLWLRMLCHLGGGRSIPFVSKSPRARVNEQS